MPTSRKPSQPNMQNLPVRTELGRQIREAVLSHAKRAGIYDRVQLYRPLTHGVPCQCTEPYTCDICYNTRFVGGYERGELVAAEKVRDDFFTFEPAPRFLLCNFAPVEAGYVFRHKEKVYRILDHGEYFPPLGITEVVCDQVSGVDVLSKFPMKEVVRI